MSNYSIYKKYINLLASNLMNTSIPCMQDILDKKEYEKILKPVLTLVQSNPYDNLLILRNKLFWQSGYAKVVDNFINNMEITPGVIVDFGTLKNRDAVICGNRQEVMFKDGRLVKDERPMEEDTIFDLASTSKIFTALAVLTLEEDKIIDVFEPVIKYAPEFKNLGQTTIYDLLKFRVNVVTPSRIDKAKDEVEALEILYQAYPRDVLLENAYTDIGAMILRVLVEKVTKMRFNDYVNEVIFKKCGMNNTFLNVPSEKKDKVASENYSSIVLEDGSLFTRYDNFPGTVHDPKAVAMGHTLGIAPGHAGYFSCKSDMIKFAKALVNEDIVSKERIYSISDSVTGIVDDDKHTRFYGSLVYLKQLNPKFLSVHLPLSGRSFMSPGFAGTELVIDPINKITLFIASPRLHNRIYQVHPRQECNINIDEYNKRSYLLPNNEEKIVSSHYAKEKEVLVRLGLDLAMQYQLLEKLYPNKKEMSLVREL